MNRRSFFAAAAATLASIAASACAYEPEPYYAPVRWRRTRYGRVRVGGGPVEPGKLYTVGNGDPDGFLAHPPMTAEQVAEFRAYWERIYRGTGPKIT